VLLFLRHGVDAVWDGEWGRSKDGCIRWGPHAPSGRAVSWGFRHIGLSGEFVEQKCIRLVHEKLTVFPYGQCMFGSHVSLAFRRYSQVQGRFWG